MFHKFERHQVRAAMDAAPIVPVFSIANEEKLKHFADAIAAAKVGGDENALKPFEFTARVRNPEKWFGILYEHIEDNKLPLLPGAGTVVDPYLTSALHRLGANYIVGPNMTEAYTAEIGKYCNIQKLFWSFGGENAGQFSDMEAMGMDVIKMFPGERVTPTYLKAIRATRPHFAGMVTGNVGFETEQERRHLVALFENGLFAVGMGSNLKLHKGHDLVKDAKWDQITANYELATGLALEAKATFQNAA